MRSQVQATGVIEILRPRNTGSLLLCRGGFLCIILPIVVFACSVSAQDHPDIVVILADDLGYGDVGFNGVKDIPTPNIDAIAANGVLCTNAYVTEPFCAPSRAAILTGRYQQRYGFNAGPDEDNHNPLQGLPLSESTLPQLLKPAGYVCGAIGKWHLGFEALDFFPLQRGFDEFVGFLLGTSNYYNANLLRGNTKFFEPDYLTDVFTQEAVSFINNHAAQPFFLYLAYNAVHDPYDVPPDEYMQRVSYITDPARQIYAAMVVAMDDGIGQVVATLQSNGIFDNTLIFFLSDNGAPTSNFGATDLSNAPLRGYKLDMLDGGIRVPFAVQWPARLPPGVVSQDLVSSLDIFPTAASAAGVSLPTDRVYDGLDITPYLAGEQASPSRTLFWRWFGLGPDGPLDALTTIWAVRNGPFKLVVERAKDTLPPALYNLTTDIGESKDLFDRKPAEVTLLQDLYDQWALSSVPDLFTKGDDRHLLPLALAGDWNDFNIDDPNPAWHFQNIDAPAPGGTPDSYDWLTSTIYVAASGGDTTPGTHLFAIVANKDYSTQWGGANIRIDDVTELRAHSGTDLGPLNTISFDDGFYYSMRVINTRLQTHPGTNMQLAAMKTSGPPVGVSRIGQTPANPTPSDPIVVSIATNQAKSPEERIFLRWSNDWFITSQMVEANGSGKSYSATIPPQPAGISVLYSIVTSTADLSGYTTSGIIDELTLSMNGTFNAVPPLPPTIIQQPTDKTVRIGGIAKFNVRATGVGDLSYRWRKNGADIPGAIRASYTTPPAQAIDDGSLFSVVISDTASTATSNDAVLTVRSR
jgi:arylsulfatase A-like enzyme